MGELESLTRLEQRSVIVRMGIREVLRGIVPPSWQREGEARASCFSGNLCR